MKAEPELRRWHWSRLFKLIMLAIPLAIVLILVDAFLIEPTWLRTPEYTVGSDPQVRVVQLADIHYKGDRAYLERIVAKVNAIHPDFACFTGDLVEENQYVDEACEILKGLEVPLYGVPGNHDYWGGERQDACKAMCAATGGAWLEDQWAYAADGKVLIAGMTGLKDAIPSPPPPPPHGVAPLRRLCLVHYPKSADEIKMGAFDLVLAGHTHGGQVDIPFLGPLVLPPRTGRYARGWYRHTPSGPLYVSVGIGTFMVKVRLNCRPELPTFSF